ncbi:MAG TPA: DUF2249 domain-containing protein [Burkholderiales bacterium]|nr:DUF2249 domain-containing protein [Burkholderiales bacterium]
MHSHAAALNDLHLALDRQLAATIDAARRGDWPGYLTHFLTLREELLSHIGYEDEELFPFLEQQGLGGAIIAELREDHAHFRELLEALSAASPRHDPEGCIAELEHLAAFQAGHHAREQAACYGHADREGAAPPPPAKPPAQAVDELPAMDLRGLQPPEPIVRIFQALERSPDTPVRAILPHEPVPLYGLLRERGFGWAGTQRTDGGFELLIRKA